MVKFAGYRSNSNTTNSPSKNVATPISSEQNTIDSESKPDTTTTTDCQLTTTTITADQSNLPTTDQLSSPPSSDEQSSSAESGGDATESVWGYDRGTSVGRTYHNFCVLQ